MSTDPRADVAALDHALASGDAEATLALLSALPEPARRKLGKRAMEWFRVLEARRVGRTPPASVTLPDEPTAAPELQRRAAKVAVLACATPKQIGSLKERVLVDPELAVAALELRDPRDWVGSWVQALLDHLEVLLAEWSSSTGWVWPVVHELVRTGLVEPPTHPGYTRGFFHASTIFDPGDRWYALSRGVAGDLCARHRDFLVTDAFWRFFEIGGLRVDHDWPSTTYGPRDHQCWGLSIARLAAEGVLPRDRLVAACLDALRRDFDPKEARWFTKLLDELAPTPEELTAHTTLLLELLASRVPTTVGWAIDALRRVDTVEPLAAHGMAPYLAPAFDLAATGKLRRLLSWAKRALKRDPAGAGPMLAALSAGLGHEHAEIQERVLDLVEAFGDGHRDTLTPEVADRLAVLAPLQAVRARAWLGEAAPDPAEDLGELRARAARLSPELARLAGVSAALAAVDADGALPPIAPFDGTDVPRLAAGTEVEPVRDLDELIELCTVLLERFTSAEDLERALDGIARLCDHRPADFASRTAALRENAFEGEGPSPVRGPLGIAIRMWLTEPEQSSGATWLASRARDWVDRARRLVLEKGAVRASAALAAFLDRGQEMGFVDARALEVGVTALQRKPAGLLALPTHAGGWIDPVVLVERVRALDAAAGECDAVQALLRMAPDRRAETLDRARELPGELGAALRHALGSRVERVGPTATLWFAAARARSPWEDDDAVLAAHGNPGPDLAHAARPRLRAVAEASRWYASNKRTHRMVVETDPPVRGRVRGPYPTMALHCPITGPDEFLYSYGYDPGIVALIASLWPQARESFAGLACMEMRWYGDVSGARINVAYLEPFLDPDVPMREMGVHALALALGAKDALTRVAARDVLVEAAADGRLSGTQLGRALAFFRELVPEARCAEPLSAAAAESSLHRALVAEAIEARLAVEEAPQRPQDFLALLALLHEIRAARGEAVADELRPFLEAFRGSGKAAKAAKALLALQAVADTGERRVARVDALRGRVERAERWVARP